MKSIILTTICCLSILFASTQVIKFKKKNGNSQKSNVVTYTIFQNPDLSYGYDIFRNGKKIVHQPNVPGIAGNAGFAQKDDAVKMANLVVFKVEKNIMPPTVTLKEIDSLKIKI